MIPVKYNVRNLRVRWVTTSMTVVGTGLVVFATILSFGLIAGLEHALLVSAHDLDLIVMRKGSQDEVSSSISQSTARELATLEGIATDSDGPLCSIEFVTILTKPRRENGGTTNLIVRGLDKVGRKLRPKFKIVEGRDIRPGLNEAITSRRMAERFENTAIGEKLEINKTGFEIVGYFESAGCAAESEIWTNRSDLTNVRRTDGAVSCVTLRSRDADWMVKLKNRISKDEQFNLKVVTEKEYFEDQMKASQILKQVGYFIAIFLTFGAMFAAANTMYAAVASRSREVGTLRALGFPRSSILMSFMLESIILCLMGGLFGCLLTLPFNGYSTGTANWATFSEITFSFRFGPSVLLQGLGMALAMGVLGGIFPAIRAVRMQIVNALRQQ